MPVASAPVLTTDTAVGPAMQTGETKTVWVNRPLLVTGLVLFGGSYGASAIVGGESGRPADRPNLYIPVAGPWIDLGQRGCSAQSPCTAEGANKTLLILDGIGQGVGALAIVTSLFIPEKTSRHYFFLGSDKLRVAPTVVGSYGMSAVGRF